MAAEQKTVDAGEARVELATRFLQAFGPATHRDFSKWSGLNTSVTKAVFDAAGGRSWNAVTVDGEQSFSCAATRDALGGADIDRRPRLLPAFDTFLLAHATKDHLVEPRFYKRVYRNQGWLSPVVIVGGRIVAVWFLDERAKTFTVDVQPVRALWISGLRDGIHAEAEALGAFLGARCDVAVHARTRTLNR